MLKYFVMGAIGGALSGVPIGPVNVAVIDTACRHHLKRAIAVALGGALADMGYALLGILWFGPLVKSHPSIPPILYAFSGIALLVYGVITFRARPIDTSKVSSDSNADESYFWSGFGLGIALILLNPATLLAWVIFLGSWMADVDRAGGIAAGLGIGVGSFIWFSGVGFLADRGKHFLQRKAVILNRGVGSLLIIAGVYSLARAVHAGVTQFF